MHRIYAALIEIVAASVFMIPVFLIYDKAFFHNVKQTFVYIVFGSYLTAVLALVGSPDITSLTVDFTVNLIPFVDMASDFVNACLNVLLFISFGFFVPIAWSGFRDRKKIILAGVGATCIIEISQIFTFRTTDVNDIITKTVGTMIGYFVAKWITKDFTQHIAPNTKNRDLYVICGTVGIIMFLLQPFVSSLLWEMVL